MSLTKTQIHEYLNRIEMREKYVLDKSFLFSLHQSHLKNVPYENFDIINKLDFNLSVKNLFEKIITNKRGGYCYELNLLFFDLLKALGFKAKLIAAQIISQDGEIGDPYDHPLIIVELEESWLVDVGNSLWFTTPISIPTEKNPNREPSEFQVDFEQGKYKMYQMIDSKRKLCYQFDLMNVNPSDFETICYNKWTTPNSKYTKHYIISKYSNETRITLKNDLITNLSKNKLTSKTIASESEFKTHVTEYFGSAFAEIITNYK